MLEENKRNSTEDYLIYCYEYAMGLVKENHLAYVDAIKHYKKGIKRYEHGCCCKYIKY